MKTLSFKKIDAFARGASSGNPAALVNLDKCEYISESEMLTVARELKGFVSEVAYLKKRAAGGYRLRYFSSEREVEFCGHATIATMYDLFKNDPELRNEDSVTIEVNSGELLVTNRIDQEDAVFIAAPKPDYHTQRIDAKSLAEVLRIPPFHISSDKNISIVNAGLETLIVPMSGLDETLQVAPGLGELNHYCKSIGVDIIILWSDEVQFEENRYRTRVFAPTFGYLEDPATGSGNAALAYYLLKENLWDGSLISIEQSDNALNPNIIKVSAENGGVVIFGGGAVTRIEGTYFLSEGEQSGN